MLVTALLASRRGNYLTKETIFELRRNIPKQIDAHRSGVSSVRAGRKDVCYG
jgi:hypothetical protein